MPITKLKLRRPEKATLTRGQMTVDSSSSVTLPKDVKFKTPFSFCHIGQGTTFKMKYLVERWTYFNKELFGNSMKQPELSITKAFKNMKIMGMWYPYTKKLVIHHKLFTLATDKQLLGTLVHEMAHQYDSEVLQTPTLERMIKKGHGPSWEHIMVSIGMPPDATFAGDSAELQDEETKENLQLRNADPKDAPNKITPASFKDQPYVHALYLTPSGKSEPVLIVNSLVGDPQTDSLYRAITKKTAKSVKYDYTYVRLSSCIKPTLTQLKKFPPEFNTIRVMTIVNDLINMYGK